MFSSLCSRLPVLIAPYLLLALVLMSVLTFGLSGNASAASPTSPWQAGKHYQQLNEHPANRRAGVVQLFSYWCLNCYRYEKMTLALAQQLPDNIALNKVHVNYLPKIAKPLQQLGTKYMLIARTVKKAEAFNQAMFNAIHNQRRTLSNEADFQAILSGLGVAAGKIDKLANYAGMKSQVNHNNKQFHGNTAVPAFIVNGKYITKVNQTMNQQELMELIVWLTEQS